MTNWSAIGAAAMALAVMLGAFGAHGLRDRLDAYSMGVYEKAVFYHFVHALGILIVSTLRPVDGGRVCGLLGLGIVLFSGSLYALAVTGVRTLGMVTPLGGVAFIAGWLYLTYLVSAKRYRMAGAMKRSPITLFFLGLVGLTLVTATIRAHQASPEKVSGQGKLRFRVKYRSEHLPAEAQKVLKQAHGGFTVDRRGGKGETYFALPGAGILQISADLGSVKLLPTDPSMKDTNMHNAMLWSANKETYLTFPGNAANKVFTTTLDGKLVNTLNAPTATDDLGAETANEYFKAKGPFIPTDVEYLNGMFYIPTGYSKLDYVLTAKVTAGKNFTATWNKLAFGGRGTGVGQFGTGHGVTVPVGKKRIDIADRPNSEIDRFTPEGKYLETVALPKGSFPCDTFYDGKYMVVGALHGPDRTKGAPIYILENDKVVSTIMAKEELGLANFQHIHNAIMRKVGKKLYVIAQAWNPGDFAILEQVD